MTKRNVISLFLKAEAICGSKATRTEQLYRYPPDRIILLEINMRKFETCIHQKNNMV